MASLIALPPLLLLLIISFSDAATDDVAPGPTPPPLNLTAILEKGNQYTTFLRLLKETQVEQQIPSQLNNSYTGLTVLAPTDNAFNQLKPGTLNALTAQEQVSLVLYHVLPIYYSLSKFQTASNPVRTQASGSHGVYTLNVTSSSNQVNFSTGVNETPISNTLYSKFPLAVYSLDEVLKPNDLFGVKAPAEAPAPAKGHGKTKKGASAIADGPSADAEGSDSAGNIEGNRVALGLSLGFGFMVWIIVGFV